MEVNFQKKMNNCSEIVVQIREYSESVSHFLFLHDKNVFWVLIEIDSQRQFQLVPTRYDLVQK